MNATLAFQEIIVPFQNESPVWTWWRKRGPEEQRWVHRCADTTLWWLCHSWLRRWGCSRSSQSCHRSLPSGRGVLPGAGRHRWPRFSQGSHLNPNIQGEDIPAGCTTDFNTMFTKIWNANTQNSTHCKYPTACTVESYTVDWRKVTEDTFVYLHVLVGGRRQCFAKTSSTRGLASTHDGCFIQRQHSD